MKSKPGETTRKKYFTAEEANLSLPLVKAVVADIVSKFTEIQDRKERLELLRPKNRPKGGSGGSMYAEELQQVEQDLETEVGRLQEYILELQALGVEFKDPVMGLVDFPALMDGREVCLCWKLGEPEVSFWHESDAGFQGRQSLLAASVTGKDVSNPDGHR